MNNSSMTIRSSYATSGPSVFPPVKLVPLRVSFRPRAFSRAIVCGTHTVRPTPSLKRSANVRTHGQH